MSLCHKFKFTRIVKKNLKTNVQNMKNNLMNKMLIQLTLLAFVVWIWVYAYFLLKVSDKNLNNVFQNGLNFHFFFIFIKHEIISKQNGYDSYVQKTTWSMHVHLNSWERNPCNTIIMNERKFESFLLQGSDRVGHLWKKFNKSPIITCNSHERPDVMDIFG